MADVALARNKWRLLTHLGHSAINLAVMHNGATVW